MNKNYADKPGIAILSAFLAAGIWGFISIPLRGLAHHASSQILFYRIVTSCLCLIIFQAFFNKNRIRKDITQIKRLEKKTVQQWIFVTVLSSVLLTANWYSFIYVINQVNIQTGAFAYMVCPLLTALIAFLVIREKINSLQKLAFLLATLAIILLASHYFREVLWSFIIAIWYAIYLVVQKFSPKIEKGFFLTLQLLLSTLLIIPYFFFNPPGFPLDPQFWVLILILSIFFTILPLYLSLYSLQIISSTMMGIIIYFNPLVSFSVAVLYFHEQITDFKTYAYILVFVALVLFNAPYFSTSKKISAA